MLTTKMEDALNRQINEEMYSAMLYLAMAGYFAELNLMGFKNWLFVQYREEIGHAEKIFNYIVNRGGKIRLYEIKEPQVIWKSPKDAFEAVLNHEKHITAKIDELVEIAESEKDRATFAMLQWFVNEQVEEEANASEVLAKLEMIGDHKHCLMMLDKETAQRK